MCKFRVWKLAKRKKFGWFWTKSDLKIRKFIQKLIMNFKKKLSESSDIRYWEMRVIVKTKISSLTFSGKIWNSNFEKHEQNFLLERIAYKVTLEVRLSLILNEA